MVCKENKKLRGRIKMASRDIDLEAIEIYTHVTQANLVK
jgi:hypothetical protein